MRQQTQVAARTVQPPPRDTTFNLKIEEIERRLANGEIDAEMEL